MAEKLDDLDLMRCFECHVILKSDSTDLTTPWGGDSILDIALAMIDIVRDLHKDRSAMYQFTDNESWLKFTRKGNDVFITADYAPGVIKVTLADLEKAANESFWGAYRELTDRHPGLKRNPIFSRLVADLSLGPKGEGYEDYLQTVTVAFDITGEVGTQQEREQIYALKGKLYGALISERHGYVHDHDYGDNEAVLYLYGEDANQVYKAVEPILRSAPFKPIRVTLRHGKANDPNARKTSLLIS